MPPVHSKHAGRTTAAASPAVTTTPAAAALAASAAAAPDTLIGRKVDVFFQQLLLEQLIGLALRSEQLLEKAHLRRVLGIHLDLRATARWRRWRRWGIHLLGGDRELAAVRGAR